MAQDVRFLTIAYFTRLNCHFYNCCRMIDKVAIQILALMLFGLLSFSQPIMETGGKKMPGEWIDQENTYFHNNPFVGNTKKEN
jgi:hypothetical protein